MAVTIGSAGGIAGSTGADITPNIGSASLGTVNIMQCVARSNAVTLTTPTGWTPIAGPIDSGTTWRSYWYWRAWQTGDTDPLNDWSAVTGDKYARIYGLLGADTTNPIAASATTAGTADPGSATGVTTTAANQFVLSLGFSADNLATAVTVTATDPASLTQWNYSTSALGADSGSWLATATRATAGATGNVSHDFNAVPLAWGILIAAINEPAPATWPAQVTMPTMVGAAR